MFKRPVELDDKVEKTVPGTSGSESYESVESAS